MITAEEKRLRQKAWHAAKANSYLSGITPMPILNEIAEYFINGELSLEETVQKMMQFVTDEENKLSEETS